MHLPQNFYLSNMNNQRQTVIRNEILQCYSSPELLGKFRVQQLHVLDNITVVLIHPHLTHQLTKFSIRFPLNYPRQNINMQCLDKSQFLEKNNYFKLQTHQNNSQGHQKLKNIIISVYQNLQGHYQQKLKNNVFNNIEKEKQQNGLKIFANQSDDQSQYEQAQKQEEPQRRKNSTMTGCSDKQLTQTKNLNRHFRSKLREVHRDLMKQCPPPNDSKFIEEVFTPNRVGFEDIRKTLQNKWFNQGIKKQMSSGRFLHKILRGMMGIKSKKLMIKYYHVMVSAVQQPSSFIRWKYQ